MIPPDDIAAANAALTAASSKPPAAIRQSGSRGLISYLPDIHRLLPQSADAEQGVLASCLLDPRALELCQSRKVAADWFHLPAHATTYSAILEMSGDGSPVDFITLTQFLRDRNKLNEVGGASFTTGLFTFLPTASNVAQYVETLEKKWKQREVIRFGTEMAARAYDEHDDVDGLLSDVERGAFAITSNSRTNAGSLSSKALAIHAVNNIQRIYDLKGGISGLSTGISELDKLTNGLEAAELILIAARPSHGKTALMMQILEHVTIEQKKHCAVFSLEMGSRALMQRAILSRARVNLQRVRDGLLSERDFPAIQDAALKLSGPCMHFEEGSAMRIAELASRCRRLHSQHGLAAVFIDSVSVLKGTRDRERKDEVSEISATLKDLSKELNIPIVSVAHLARGAKKRPSIDELGESDSLGKNSDKIWMLVREALLADSDEEAEELEGKSFVRIAKSRDGGMMEKVNLSFLPEFCRFEPRKWEPEAQSETTPEPKKQWRR